MASASRAPTDHIVVHLACSAAVDAAAAANQGLLVQSAWQHCALTLGTCLLVAVPLRSYKLSQADGV